MDAAEFDEEDFFAAIARSGARVLLIGRRALRRKDIEDISLLEDLKRENEEER